MVRPGQKKYRKKTPVNANLPDQVSTSRNITTTQTRRIAQHAYITRQARREEKEFDAEKFPHITVCRGNQKNKFNRIKKYDFANRSASHKSSCIDGWYPGQYFHPPFRTGGFYEIDALQVFQLSTPINFQATAGRIYHKELPIRWFPTHQMVAGQRVQSRKDHVDVDNPVNEYTNVGHRTIQMVRADHAGSKKDPLYVKKFKGYLMPGKRDIISYQTAERSNSDDLFEFWGEEGTTIKDDVYNHCTFYQSTTDVNGCTPFIDIIVQQDYEDLVRYSGRTLSQQCEIRNTFKFWQDARKFRQSKPLPELSMSIAKIGQLCEFNPKTLDDSSQDSCSDTETIVEAKIEITITSEGETIASEIELPVISADEADDAEISFNEVIDGSFENPSAENSQPIHSSPVATIKAVPLAILPPILPVDELVSLPESCSTEVQPSHSVGDCSALNLNIDAQSGESVPMEEYLEMIDFHALTVSQAKDDHKKQIADLESVHQKTISDKNAENSKWMERAKKAREDLLFVVNQNSATIEVISAGMSIHNRQVTQTKVFHQAILVPGSTSNALHRIKIVEQPNQVKPDCANSCINNLMHNSLVLCDQCQFGVTGSAAIGLLQNAIDRTRHIPRKFQEGHFNTELSGPRPAKVVIVTEIAEDTTSLTKKADRKIVVAKRKALNVCSKPIQNLSSADEADESISETLTEIKVPDLGCLNDFDQSTSKFSQEQIEKKRLSLDQIRVMDIPKSVNIVDLICKCDCSPFEKASGQCFCKVYGHKTSLHDEIVAERERINNSAGLRIFIITKELVSKDQLSYAEATLNVKANHPLLYARWETEKAEETKREEARYESQVSIVNGDFKQGTKFLKFSPPGANDFQVKFGLEAVHKNTSPPTAAAQLSKMIKDLLATNGHNFAEAEKMLRQDHPELVKLAEAEIKLNAAKNDPSDHDEYFTCPSN